jgi:hypothetical protein
VATTLADGSRFKVDRGNRDGYRSHHWGGRRVAGDYAGASRRTRDHSLTDNLWPSCTGQFLGNIYNGYIVDLD